MPDAIGGIVVHGTGTPLGDPIEVSALGMVIATAPSYRRGPLTLLSTKAVYGHTEGAAGKN